MDALLIALQFLTRIPLPWALTYTPAAQGRSVLFYPLIGLLLGVLLTGLAWSLQSSPSLLAAALLLSAWVLLTGGLHLDGLADCADAWVGGHGDRQRSLQIMKDPACGPIAVALLVLVLLLKFSALTTLLDNKNLLPVLIIPLMSRASILLLMLSTPYVSRNGLGETLHQQLPKTAATIVTASSALLVLFTLSWPSLLAAGLVVFAIRSAALQRLGGATGDVYGAAVELSEAAALVAVAL